MKDTRSEILAIGEELIRTRGYHGFSYKDIASVLQIKNAAIHYYFPTKADLGEAIVDRNIDGFSEFVKQINQKSEKQKLEQFIGIYEQSQQRNWVCMMGATTPVYETLPKNIQKKVNQLGNMILDWLKKTLKTGRKNENLAFDEKPSVKAHLIASSLMAALLIQKVDKRAFRNIKKGILKEL